MPGAKNLKRTHATEPEDIVTPPMKKSKSTKARKSNDLFILFHTLALAIMV